MSLSDYADLATVAASVLVVIQLGAGLFVYIRQIKRERVIATLEYFEGASKDVKLAKRELRKRIGGEITEESIQSLKANQDDKILLHKVLNAYERLATGLNLAIYDLETLARINGKILVSNYERFEPYIEHRRATKNANAWTEFSKLVDRIRRIRKDLAAVPDDPNE